LQMRQLHGAADYILWLVAQHLTLNSWVLHSSISEGCGF
jgi:hypothetical protein